MRRMIGFKDRSDFPNELNSWSDSLHPEDKQAALDAFSKNPGNCKVPVPVPLRSKTRPAFASALLAY